MARITDETIGNAIKSQWSEAGLTFRSNLFTKENNQIQLHVHSFDHVSIVTHGWLEVTETKDGLTKSYQVASKDFKPNRTDIPFEPVGYKILIPKGHQHAFKLLEAHNQPAEVLCIFPEGAGQDDVGQTC